MLVVVSPAKRLDWSVVAEVSVTAPRFADDAVYLAGVARRLSKPRLQALMKISPDLARLNQQRFRDFSDAPPDDDLRPAAFAFAGDTYQGLEARSLDRDARDWAQGHLRILSGLYGLLRPCDGIQPYRLEMGSRLKTRKAADLYGYWDGRIADALNADVQAAGARFLLDCASQEYFGAVATDALEVPVISPVFLDEKDGVPRIISFHAKRARGAMARFVMERRIDDPEGLLGFEAGGYAHDPARSTPDRPVFLRRAPQMSEVAA
jgi:cytoplasmic iron level regulating protein YaaA (DUF328/UPF0246 family)